jgi:hypothetical protein
MRLFAVIAVALITLSPVFRDKQSTQSQKQTSDGPNIPAPSPVTVFVNQTTPQTQKEGPQNNVHNGPPIWSNWALVLVAALAALAAIKTLRAIEAQVTEMRNTGKQTDKLITENIAQSASLERSVRETARSASAMEEVARSLRTTAELSSETVRGLKQQMRAYVSAVVGGAVFQDRANNLKFQGSPAIVNSGLTPAHKVRHKAKAAILPVPLPDDFNFPLPESDSGENMIGPRQQTVISPIVDDFIDDADVPNVKAGLGHALYVWGTIEYEDVFGQAQSTRFCQILTWLQDGKTVWGYFVPGHNDGT